jgi:hemerythrin-like domain-containing protein
MHPTEILEREHDVILSVLACLERIVLEAEGERRLAAEPARAALEFFRTFADLCHHHKEEELLFPRLVQRGLPRNVGPVAVMLQEHCAGRDAVGRMARELDGAAAGHGEALAAFAGAAREYVRLLREHIAKENEVLFPMAEGMLSEEERAALARAFEAAEGHHEPGTHARLVRVAEELCTRYGVDPEAAAALAAGGCMHGGCGHHA